MPANYKTGGFTLATFKINAGVNGTSFYPEITAAKYQKQDGFFYFTDKQNRTVDCIAANLVHRIVREEED